MEELELKSKYYTPTIDEFHVGFEYEELTHKRNHSVGYIDSEKEDWAWKERVFGKNIVYNTDLNFEFKYQEWNDFYTRIKYLDKSDIESLGFDYYKTHPGTTTMEFENGDYMLTFDADFGDSWNCTIEFEKDVSVLILFHGIIKNKSELKRLLKQLRINADK